MCLLNGYLNLFSHFNKEIENSYSFIHSFIHHVDVKLNNLFV